MLSGYYDPTLVIVSILVAIFASYTSLSLADRVKSSQGLSAYMWTGGGALAMGTGIWAMHFLGMLAFRLPIPLGYDFGLTALSLLLPVAVSALALWQLRHRTVDSVRLAAAALLLGLGINCMHYTGMAAMRMEPGIIYDPLTFAASVLIAIGAASGALWIAFRLRQRTPRASLIQIAAAVVMGLAVAGMHYTGMAAAHFPADSVCRATGAGADYTTLALFVTLATAGILTIALIVSIYDARLEARTHILAASIATAEERRTQFLHEQDARVALARLNEQKDEFLATLSHELRTPLNSVLGWSQLLQQQGLQERVDPAALQRGLAAIERNARAQARMIDELLDMSAIAVGKVQIAAAPVWPGDFVLAALETVGPAALAGKIEIVTQLDRSAGPVWADASRMQQVMGNVLANAVKFTPPGGHVVVTLSRTAEGIAIRVADNGIGIASEILPFIFERFRQGDSSTTRRHGGLGLGLSIARQLVEIQGGVIVAESAGIGAGAAVTVRLPLHVASNPPRRTPQSAQREDRSADCGGLPAG